MLPSTAGLLLLSALQPALGQEHADCRSNSSNKLLFKQITPQEILMGYNANNTGCNAGVKAWVGVWAANDSPATKYKAWKYLEANEGEVRFNKTELGDGQWKAAFLCEDGRRMPFLMSDNFELGSGVPVPKPRTCNLTRKEYDGDRFTWNCDELKSRCNDCTFDLACDLCNECARQCGKPANY